MRVCSTIPSAMSIIFDLMDMLNTDTILIPGEQTTSGEMCLKL